MLIAFAMADRGWVVLIGDFSNERLDFASIGREFSWCVSQTSDLAGLEKIGRSNTVIAVLIQAGALDLPWADALRVVRHAAPRARIILCHKVDQAGSRNAMVKAGAFGVLLLPLAHTEVRQALGFVWASEMMPSRQIPTKKVQPIDVPARRAGAA